MSSYISFEPLDVLMLRGNRLFGGGVHGESHMPPWPSLFSGALASRALRMPRGRIIVPFPRSRLARRPAQRTLFLKES
jgi:hypothetical protein